MNQKRNSLSKMYPFHCYKIINIYNMWFWNNARLLVFLSRQQPESPEHISSTEESVSSFTSASSLPLLRRDRPHVYESTLTLQRMSSLLTDGENQSREEEDEEEEDSRTPSSTDDLLYCPEVTVTLDGATDPIFPSNSNKDALVELVLSAEGKLNVGFYLHRHAEAVKR